jgi:hypothetical protein
VWWPVCAWVSEVWKVSELEYFNVRALILTGNAVR